MNPSADNAAARKRYWVSTVEIDESQLQNSVGRCRFNVQPSHGIAPIGNTLFRASNNLSGDAAFGSIITDLPVLLWWEADI
jgi:hypothetical protein